MRYRRERNEKEYANEEIGGEDFYSEEEIDLLLEDDEISVKEEAFMKGYMDA